MSLVWLNEKSCENPEFAGNKGANLAKLKHFGYKVPNGFCISGDVVESEIRQALKNLPPPWAVRSSSSAEDSTNVAFAGIFETILGLTTPEDIILAIKKVKNSKKSDVVKRYAKQNKINLGQIEMAVIVQTLINPDCSGVAFSHNPVSGNENVVIEANFGLGETLVDGSISPDYYEINRSGKIIESRIGTKKMKAEFRSGEVKIIKTSENEREQIALNSEMAKKLAKFVKKIANDFDSPQDVEWAIADNQIYILQSRPITTLNNTSYAETNNPPYFEKVIKNAEWQHYLTRRYTLFGTSLWQHTYASNETTKVFGANMPFGLYIEDQPGIVRLYRQPKELADFQSGAEKLIKREDDLKRFLIQGHQLNSHIKKMLSKPDSIQMSLDEAVSFLDEHFVKATMLAYWSLKVAANKNLKDPSILELAKELRQISFYRQFIREIMAPLAIVELKNRSIENAEDAVHYLTLQEIYKASQNLIDERRLRKQNNERFCFIGNGRSETIDWLENSQDLISQLESIKVQKGSDRTIGGNVAFKGKATGRAILILTTDDLDKKITSKDILVMVSSNPQFVKLMQTCGGIVVDEGGITSHAAIMARELKKPCIIGTQFGTHFIKENDVVELDANRGIVKIL